MVLLRLSLLLAIVALTSPSLAQDPGGDWVVEDFRKVETIDLRTNVAGEGDYWFPVWVVVIEGEPFVRLGSRAAERFQANSTFPEISLRLNGQRFDRVRGEPVPDYTVSVAEAMAEKYWSDVFVRWFSHPLTLRLVRVREDQPAAP